jgi:hypothetical protein
MIPQVQVYQRKRTVGWVKPSNSVYVGRPSMWGNPFYVLNGKVSGIPKDKWHVFFDEECLFTVERKIDAQTEAVRLFSIWFDDAIADIGTPLHDFRNKYGWRGFQLACVAPKLLLNKNLLCWCNPSDPCHARHILEFVMKRTT